MWTSETAAGKLSSHHQALTVQCTGCFQQQIRTLRNQSNLKFLISYLAVFHSQQAQPSFVDFLCRNTSVEAFYHYSNDSSSQGYYYLNDFSNLLVSGGKCNWETWDGEKCFLNCCSWLLVYIFFSKLILWNHLYLRGPMFLDPQNLAGLLRCNFVGKLFVAV